MEAAAVHPDWSGGLPLDLLLVVIRALDISDLLHAGAVCASWRAARAAIRRVRVPITDASPCLLYSCAADDDADTTTIYRVSVGTTFKIRLPEPAFRSRYVLGSGHGWVIAADEESNLHLFNPLTAAQMDLPPVTGLYNVESFSNDQGRLMYKLYGEYPHPESPMAYDRKETRFFVYERAYLSCSPSKGAACVVLLLHQPVGDLSFARLDESESVQWSSGYRGAVYNEKDSLFYLTFLDSSIYTLDLNSGLPVMKKVFQGDSRCDGPIKSIVLTPWGDILQVWRFIEASYRDKDNPVEVSDEDFVGGFINPNKDSFTEEIDLYKVDLSGQKLVKISSSELRGHSIFIGFNTPMLVSMMDFPMFQPNCAYTTDDSSETICINMYGRREVGIWNFETKALESLGDVQLAHPWLNWPPPVWITPSIF